MPEAIMWINGRLTAVGSDERRLVSVPPHAHLAAKIAAATSANRPARSGRSATARGVLCRDLVGIAQQGPLAVFDVWATADDVSERQRRRRPIRYWARAHGQSCWLGCGAFAVVREAIERVLDRGPHVSVVRHQRTVERSERLHGHARDLIGVPDERAAILGH